MVRWCWLHFKCRGVLLIKKIVGQEPIALSVGAGGGCLDRFSLVIFSFLPLSLSWRRLDIDRNTVSKGRQLKTNQPTNQINRLF